MVNFKAAMNSVGRVLKKELPTIFTFLGIGGVIAGTVIACDKSRDLDELLNEVKDDIEEKKSEITEDQNRGAALTKIYICAGGKIAKHYWLPAVIETGSIGLLIASNQISRNRINAALTACNLANFKYEEVKKQFAEHLDNDISRAEEPDEISTKTEESIDLKRQNVVDLSFMYDERFTTWTDEPYKNWITVSKAIKWAEEEGWARTSYRHPGELSVGELICHLGIGRKMIPPRYFHWGWRFYNRLDDVPENEVYCNGEIDLGLYDYLLAEGRTYKFDRLKAFVEGEEPCAILNPKYVIYLG